MKTNKVIQLLSALSEQEMQKFRQFLASDYHQVNPDVRRLFDYLATCYPDFSDEKVKKALVFETLYPGQSIEEKPHKVKNRASDLSRIIEDFMILELFQERKIERAFQVFHALKSRKQNHLSLLQLNKINRLLEQQQLRNRDYYYLSSQVNHEYFFHPKISMIKTKSSNSTRLKDTIDNLSTFYRIACLHYLSEAHGHKTLYGTTYDISDDFLSQLSISAAEESSPLANIYAQLIQLIKEPRDSTYQSLKNMLLQHFKIINNAEQVRFLTLLINYQAGEMSKGRTKASREILDLYEFRIKAGLFKVDQYFHAQHFMNISVLASELGKTKWLEDFIHAHKAALNPKLAENVINLSMAYLRFAQKDYEATIQHTGQVVYDNNIAYSLPCWTLSIRSYFEHRQKIDGVDEELTKFSNYINGRKGLAENRVLDNKNFISLMRKLLRTVRRNAFTKEELMDHLDYMENIVCKSWFVNKIEGLKK